MRDRATTDKWFPKIFGPICYDSRLLVIYISFHMDK
jgi:hypothetical protein